MSHIQYIVTQNTTQFFSATVLKVTETNIEITNNNYTVKVNADNKQQFDRVIKKYSLCKVTLVNQLTMNSSTEAILKKRRTFLMTSACTG